MIVRKSETEMVDEISSIGQRGVLVFTGGGTTRAVSSYLATYHTPIQR